MDVSDPGDARRGGILDPYGNLRWVKTFQGRTSEITSVIVDASGAVFAAGDDRGNDVTLEGPLTTPSAFITKLSSDGQQLFTTRVSSVSFVDTPYIMALASSPSGEVAFSGSFGGSISFGPMSFSAPSDGGAFVAKISSTGEPRWLDPIETPFGRAAVLALAVGPSGHIYATGQYRGDELRIAGLTLGPTSGVAMFLLELDAGGNATDGRIFDHAGQLSAGRALAVDPAGALVLAGHFLGQIDLDDQTLRSATLGSSFVARLALPFASHRRE